MKILKFAFFMLLCLTLALSISSALPAFAETYSGTCGSNVTWTLDTDTGVLTISGTGDMKNYSASSKQPWYNYRTSITSVRVEDNVTSIGKYAFYNCTELANVTIGDSVTSIGNQAFYKCANLANVSIGNNVTTIGEYAFYSCTELKDVTMGNNIVTIGNYSFYDCSGLTNIVIGNNVVTIGNYSFYGCSGLTNIAIGNNVVTIGNYAFYGCKGLTNIAIGNNVVTIGNYAFYDCSGIASVTIPNAVTSIGSYAFYNCTGLTSALIGDGVTSIGEHAFYNCTGLTNVSIGDSVTSIGSYAFEGCTMLMSVTIPDSVTSIGIRAFYGCSGLKSLTIGRSVVTIGNLAFSGCTKLADVTIPDSVTSIGNVAFENCTGLVSLTIGNGGTTIGLQAFYGCTGLADVTIGNGASIGQYAFLGCNGFTNFKIGSNVSINDDAFSGFSSLTDLVTDSNVGTIFTGAQALERLTLGEGVTSIDDKAFSGCSSLTSVTIPSGVTSIGDYAFRNCSSLINVTIDDGEQQRANDYSYFDCSVLTSIGEKAFYNCTALTSINIPSSVTTIGYDAFYECSSLTDVYITDLAAWLDINFVYGTSSFGNERLSSNPLYYAENLYINGELAEDLVIPDGIEKIKLYAFYGLKCVKNVTIPDSVATIGSYAFYECTSLESAAISDGVTTINSYAFYKCTSLESIAIPDSVTSIGSYAFSYCTSLKNITIPGSVTEIESYTFTWCTSLTNVRILNGVEKINEGAFASCHSLTTVYLPNSLVKMGSNAFNACEGITDVYFEGSSEERESISGVNGNGYIKNATWHYNDTITTTSTKTVPEIHNLIFISAKGGQGITYDVDDDSYSESEFELDVSVIGMYLTGASEAEKAMQNAVVTITLPEGFSFYEDKTIRARRYEFDTLHSVPKIEETVYVQNPGSGDFEITIRASAEDVGTQTYKYAISIETSVFELNKYRADWFLDSGTRTICENYFNGDTPSKLIYQTGQENGLGTATAAWSALMDTLDMADNPSSVLDYVFEEKDMYEAIIMSLFEASVDYSLTSLITNETVKDANSLISTAAKEMKTLYNIDVYDSSNYSGMSDSEIDALADIISNAYEDLHPTASLVSDITGYIKTTAGYVSDVQTLLENVTAYINIRQLSGSMKQVMRDMYSNCPSDNLALKAALLDCITVISDSELDFAADMSTYAFAMVGKDVAQYCIDQFWGGVKTTFCAAHPAAFTFMAAYIGGKTIANKFFNADGIEEEYCKIAALNEVWDLALTVYTKERSSFSLKDTDKTAQIYNSMIDVMFSMLDTDCEYALSYADAIDDAWAQKIFDAFGDTSISDYKETVEGWQNLYTNGHINELTNWVANLAVDFPSRYDDYEYLLDATSVSDIKKKLNINCPVDVYVLNKNGSILGYVKDNVPYCVEGAEITIGVSGDSKTIYLYDDEYVIRYIGNDEGTMDITVTEYDSSGDEARTVYFYDIALSDGLIYTSVEDGETLVSDAYYLMDEDGEEILPDYDSLDANSDAAYTASITRGYFTKSVEVETELNAGDKAEIAAYVPEGYKFVGWTSDAGYDIFADAESVTTTITMPDCDVNITAEVEETATLKITSAENGVIEVQALNCEEITSGTIYISVYDADDVHKATVTAPWAESVSISELEFESGDIIRAFLWDENMQPLASFAQRMAS